MRRFGAALTAIGLVVTGIGLAHPTVRPLICTGILVTLVGSTVFLSSGAVRTIPETDAPEKVRRLFEEVANDSSFFEYTGLRPAELEVLKSDLQNASFRWSKIIQGGYAGRDEDGRLILAVSRWHLRRAAVAHELLHLARDVMYRLNEGQAGRDLNDTRGVLWEETVVWYQTLRLYPLAGAIEIVGPLMILCVAPGYSAYWIVRFLC